MPSSQLLRRRRRGRVRSSADATPSGLPVFQVLLNCNRPAFLSIVEPIPERFGRLAALAPEEQATDAKVRLHVGPNDADGADLVVIPLILRRVLKPRKPSGRNGYRPAVLELDGDRVVGHADPRRPHHSPRAPGIRG